MLEDCCLLSGMSLFAAHNLNCVFSGFFSTYTTYHCPFNPLCIHLRLLGLQGVKSVSEVGSLVTGLLGILGNLLALVLLFRYNMILVFTHRLNSTKVQFKFLTGMG